MSRRALAVVAIAFAGAARAAYAQFDLSPEFQVNAYTTGSQFWPSVGVQPDGSFVVTWSGHSSFFAGQSESEQGVVLRRFDAAGVPLGDEQAVNTFTAEQASSDVSVRGDGSFVVVWNSGCYHSCSADGSGRGVGLRRFDAAGVPEGVEQIANTSTLGDQQYPRVAARPTGEFVVVWESGRYRPPEDDHIIAQRFSPTGAFLGGELTVDSQATSYQFGQDVAIDGAGNFVVVWVNHVGDPDGYDRQVLARRYDASGTPLGDQVEVTDGTERVRNPAVASTSDGQFVVVWEISFQDIRGQRFSADGTPIGTDFLVNSRSPGDKVSPAVASDAAGNFVVAWQDGAYFGSGQDGQIGGISAQAFANDGAPLGHQLQVNTYTIGLQLGPAIGANAAGEFVIAWTSQFFYGPTSQDGDGAGVFGRRVALHKCGGPDDCDDADPCTNDDCEGGVCLNRRQAGCCQLQFECDDKDPCTDDLCADTTCQHPMIPGCVPCASSADCEPPDACTYAYCDEDRGACELEVDEDCCLSAADCDDGHACTVDACDASNECSTTPLLDCVECGSDAECSTGCVIGPETCDAGRCESPAGCPVVTIDDGNPRGAGKLLAHVDVPADVPGKGKIKVVMTAAIGQLDPGDQPSRRCKQGKVIGQNRAVVQPGSGGDILLGLLKPGVRCLTNDPDGALPVDVTVQVRRKKTAFAEVVAPRTWQR